MPIALVYHASKESRRSAVAKKTVVGLGELLWDLLPSGARMGGAPANFAVMASRLGNRGVIASRLGVDDWGARARGILSELPADISFLQTDAAQPTGTVGVKIVENEPHYIIHEPAAWDYLEWSAEWRELATQADAVCFGSLAQRAETSRATIRQFVTATRPECVRVFDVNLREPFFSVDVVAESLAAATIFKLNELEVPLALGMLGSDLLPGRNEDDLRVAAEWLLAQYPLKLVAITMGAAGSLLVTPQNAHRRQGIHGSVVDTVGAGDAFTAALVTSYLAGASLAQMNEAGNRWGAWVASQPGGMPELSAETLAEIQGKIAEV
jgi:fructokinase